MGLLRFLFRALFGRPRARYTYIPSPQEPTRRVTVTRRTMAVAVTMADATLTGRCWVIDGDTIDIGGKRSGWRESTPPNWTIPMAVLRNRP